MSGRPIPVARAPPAGGASAGTSGAPAAASGSTGGAHAADGPLASLRNHPQFNQLKGLIQSNPAVRDCTTGPVHWCR